VTASPEAISSTGYTYVRMFALIDKQPNSSTLTVATDYFEPVGVTSLFINSPINAKYRSRVTMLYDRVLLLSPGTSVSKQVNIYKKLNLPVSYVDGTTAIPETNNIVVGFISNEHNEVPTVIWQNRIRFSDA